MQPTAILLLSALAGGAAAAGVTFALQPTEVAVDTGALQDLQRVVEELRSGQRALQQRLDAVANAPAPVTAAPAAQRSEVAAPSEAQIAAAVEAYLSQRGGGAKDAAAQAAGAGKPGFDLAADFQSLVGTNYWENTETWKKAFAAGRMDEVIKQFEALAAAAPNDTAVQMNLANAYMAYLQMDQSKWQLSMKADEVFDNVLALDDKHWEARFTKAVSYTFYPDFLGKKKDAITHFETLVQQQESLPIERGHAETYLYLGNLLEARDPARAREIWQKGARRHPDNQELGKKLAQ
jgi:tetratricopeptide (TPR) repeat protein